ncbi:MAG: ribosome small subunit-dependent GTPase A, partial [Nocardioidaceae bacterium]
RRELCPLPGGGAVIDTPGLRGVGLPYAEEGLGATFPDIEALAVQCRFNDCTHTQEPGCEVLAAVDGGRIAVRRLESWQKLRREMEWMDTRTDARLRAAQNQQLRRVTRQRRRAGRSDGDP